jgi:UDP-glucose 4-epimerase
MQKGAATVRILITGGAGFIGSNLARHILGREPACSVRVIDDLSTGSLENLSGLPLEFTDGTILDFAALLDAVQGVDTIVHLAAIPSVPRSIADPRASHEANTTGTLNVLEAARQASVNQVIVASSSSVYGSNPQTPKSELTWTRPMSPYAVSKQATEGYAIAYQYSYGLRTLAFRFFNVYGPHQAATHPYAAVIPKFLHAALLGQPVEIQGDGLQARDFTYVGTVCAVVYDAIVRQIHAEHPINLAFGTRTNLLELLTLMESELKCPIERKFAPARVGDVRASQADPGRLLELFPGVAAVGLRDGLHSTVDWMRNRTM